MGEVSKIAWTDATFNPWWGCSRVSPGCENCYAETLATVRRKLPVWGVDAERKPMSEAYWREPERWNRTAEKTGVRRRVFCASMADVFEHAPARNVAANAVMTSARGRLFGLIERTPHLDWLLLTKRPQNVAHLVPWGGSLGPWPPNVWLGTTTENQQRYDERWPIIAQLGARVRFISHEPALGPLELRPAKLARIDPARPGWSESVDVLPDWVITGGESGHGARPYRLDWAASVIAECRRVGAAPFVKQLGAEPWLDQSGIVLEPTRVHLRAKKGDDPSEWPATLRVQEFPAVRPS